MNKQLLFDFVANKQDNTVTVTREFAAPLTLVWDAWTRSELLDQWWAPHPYKVRTKTMDFREGGHWLYAMISPEGEAHWCRADYQQIKHKAAFTCTDAFCDEEGNINTAFPRAKWNNQFKEGGDSTTVHITIQYDSLADLEKIIEMGFKEGFTMGLNQLDTLLQQITQSQPNTK